MQLLCGTKAKDPGYRFEAGCYDQWQLIIVLEGGLGMTVRQSDTLIRPGWAAMLPAGSAFRLWCRDTRYRGVYVILRDIRGEAYRGRARAIDVGPEMVATAALVEGETRCPADRSDAYLRAAGLLLAEQALRSAGSKAREAYAPTPEYWVSRARPLIERSIYSSTPLGQVLGGLGIGYRQLTRHFKSVLGTTPKQYQLHCRLREADRLLRETALSITSIAMELGFSSSQHFSARFASDRGCSPTAWRTARRADVASRAQSR
jgi:AraC-like DNA-binding protein